MGVSSGKHDHARHRHGPCRRDDRGKTPPRLRGIRQSANRLIHLLLACLLATAGAADPIRIASYHPALSRNGPGLLLRDILRGEDQVAATISVMRAARPDILLLTNFDWDADGLALSAFADLLAKEGLDLPYRYAAPGNTGLPSGLDLNGDGRSDGDADNQGFGRFRGDGALALLSRWPVDAGGVRDLSPLLWRDLPGAQMPEVAGRPFPSEAAHTIQRLSSTAHLVIPVTHPRGVIHLLAFRATPPVFDGPEDRNGLRNADEIRLWQHVLDGALGPVPDGPLVVLGNANLDPARGSGRRAAIAELLNDPRLSDPRPPSAGGESHGTPMATADWDTPRPGKLRVDYVLPSRDWTLLGAGIVWPGGDDPLAKAVAAAGPHRLVWADLAWPGDRPE